MTLTPQQEKTLHHCMILGLIHALYRTQQLTQEQTRALLSDPALWNR